LKRALTIIAIILAADQFLKIYIKTHFAIGYEKPLIGNWLLLHFIENNGMAFGLELGGSWGKILLSSLRILLVGGIGILIYNLIKTKQKTGVIACFSLIFAGAVGNIIDSLCYGLLFSESSPITVATLLPESGGYSTALHGKVVDMIYFHAQWPQWMPWIGGNEVFPHVFNIADAAITTGVLTLIVFHRDFFKEKKTVGDSNTHPLHHEPVQS
jgi:signal peptidase II